MVAPATTWLMQWATRRQWNCLSKPVLCVQYGFTNKVVPAADLLVETQVWAEKLAKGSPLAQKFGNQIMKQAVRSSLSDVIDLEAKILITTTTSEDYLNAAMVFFNKETPVFNGR